jgi:hypothetical protein
MDTLTDKLRKISALAEHGTEGEKANAKRLLEELCAKHGVRLEQLLEPKKEFFVFKYSDEFERKIFVQTLAMICGWNVRHIPPGKRRKKYECELTQVQYLDVKEAYARFRKAWRAQLDDVCSAFIHANKIYGPPEESDREEELSEAERQRIKRVALLAFSMPSNPWEKRLRLTA